MPTWTIQLAPQQLLRVHQRAVRLTPYLGIVRRPPHDVRQPGRERALRQSVAEGGWVVHRHHLVRLAHHPRWDVSRSEDLGRTREPHEDDIHNDTHRAHQVGAVWRGGAECGRASGALIYFFGGKLCLQPPVLPVALSLQGCLSALRARHSELRQTRGYKAMIRHRFHSKRCHCV